MINIMDMVPLPTLLYVAPVIKAYADSDVVSKVPLDERSELVALRVERFAFWRNKKIRLHVVEQIRLYHTVDSGPEYILERAEENKVLQERRCKSDR